MPDVPFTKNAGDPKQVEGAQAQARRIERTRLGWYKAVLQTVEGRAVCWDLLQQAGLFVTSWAQSGSQVYFNEGQRNMGLQLRATLEEADEHMVEVMEREARTRRRQAAEESGARHLKSVGDTNG